MASPNSTFTELVTSTFRNHKKEVKDNVSNRNALYAYLSKKGNHRVEDGGLTIVANLEYATNGTYQRYSDWDVLNIAQSDVISAAEYQWRQIALNVVSSGRDLRLNSGKSKIFNLAKARIKNAMNTFGNSFSSDLYSDGTATNQINGLQALVANAGTGTVGGINSSTFSFWQNKVQSAAAPLNSASAFTMSASTIEGSGMLPLWLALDRGINDAPDLIIMDSVYYGFFEASQVSLKRYMPESKVSAGFVALKYKNADVIYDGGSGIPASSAYFLNTNYFELVVHQDADLEIMDEQRPINQDGVVIPIVWMGNLVLSNRAQQGIMKA